MEQEDVIRDKVRIGGVDYRYGEEDMNKEIGGELLNRGWSLGTVESCTGGYIGKYLTGKEGSSEYYKGGLIVYSNDLKERLLGIMLGLIEEYGVVSREVVEEMARRGRERLCVDGCLGTTGWIEREGMGVCVMGEVWYGWILKGGMAMSQKYRIEGLDREEVRSKMVYFGLNLLRLSLKEFKG